MKKKAIQWKSFLKSLNRNVYEIGEERVMTLEEIKSGESKNVEFKIMLPDDSKNYMKTIVAYANTSGGKIIIGVDDVTRNIVGVEPSSVFQIMDKIANSVSVSGCHLPDDRRKMYCSDRNISGTEQAILYTEYGKRERNLYSSGRNKQTCG